MKIIKFSPPDITDLEVAEVAEALRSGWITTGPKTKLFESKIAEFCHGSRSISTADSNARTPAVNKR